MSGDIDTTPHISEQEVRIECTRTRFPLHQSFVRSDNGHATGHVHLFLSRERGRWLLERCMTEVHKQTT